MTLSQHVVVGTAHGSPRDLVTVFKNRLDHFREAARAGAAYALCAPAMMRPQLASRDVQDWLGDSPAQARFQDVHGRLQHRWRLLSLDKINESFSTGRHLFAQVEVSALFVEQDWIDVRTRHPSPDLALG